MGNLLKMDFLKLRKFKMFFVFLLVILAVTIVLPILGKIFSNILLNIVENSGEGQAIAEAEMLVEEFNRPYALSNIFRAPMGGLSILWMLLFISGASFMYMDLANGYVKNIAGQIPSHGYLAVSKLVIINIHNIAMMLVGVIGSLIGYGVSRGLTADADIGAGIVEFLLKILLASALSAVLLFFTTGLGNKALGIVLGVFLGLGMMSLLYVPLNFALSRLLDKPDLNLSAYMPDQMVLMTQINVWAALIEGIVLTLVFLFLTMRFVNRRDVK